METCRDEILSLSVRVIAGILFFFQGYDKIVNVKVKNVAAYFKQELKNIKIPDWFLRFSASFTSWVEMIGGVLLIAGLAKYEATYLLMLDMILVAGAFSLIKPMWDMQHHFPRLILLIIILYLPSENDVFTLDYLISRFR